MKFPGISFISISLLMLFSQCAEYSSSKSEKEWHTYRGDDGINAYSSLDEINRSNVKNLKVAWTYRTGDTIGRSNIECNPLIIDETLYGVSPKMKVFALDAKTGKQKWIYDPFDKNSKEGGVSRGVTYWREGDDQRIFFSASYKLIALDAITGKQIMSFGDSGFVDMRKGLRNDSEIEKYYVTNTSPGVVFKDQVIVGASLNESYLDLPGHIRSFDARTGKLRWIFNTIPKPGEFGYETWPKDAHTYAGGSNAWSGLSIDRERGMVFAATGAPAFDFHGGSRKGDNLFANSVIALNAETGKYIWHFQVSHHDLWDYDLPSPPNLITIKKDGKEIDAVAQITKQSFIFLLDRETGKPIYEVKEMPVPQSIMNDEFTSATQPFPSFPEALSPLKFDTSQVTNISAEAREFVMKEIAKYDYGSIYMPPHTRGIIQLPGFRGGAEWSGAAVDKETGIMYVGTNNIANIVQLVELENNEQSLEGMSIRKAGEVVYQQNCSPCHGADRKGSGPYPSLLDVNKRLSVLQAAEIIEKGRNKMPAFANLPAEQRDAAISFLYNLKENATYKTSGDTVNKVPAAKQYKIKGYTQLKDQEGYYGTKPPWGILNALDLNTGQIKWKIPLGEYPELVKRGIRNTGTQLFGGGIVTAGGLVFIGATKDEKFRAIDKDSGKILWEYQLPAGGYATPSTYEAGGKQYVVIAAGGGGFQLTKPGDWYVAFALEGE